MNLPEQQALREFIDYETPLKRALEHFRAAQESRYQGDCAQYMATVPRDTERASDAAARADAFGCWWNELASFATRSERDSG